MGTKGERKIPIGSFFTGPFATALSPDEILVEIRIPASTARSGGAYLKLERKVGDFATAAVAVHVVLSAGGTCDQVGIGLTNVGLTPIKATQAEAALKGKHPGRSRHQAGARSWPRRPPQPSRRSTRVGRVQERPRASADGARPSPGGRARRRKEVSAMRIQLSVNGEKHEADVEPRLLLVHLLRENLRLTGTHIGCDTTPLRRLHGADGRPCGEIVHGVRGAGQRQAAHDRRGPGAERHAPPAAGRLHEPSTGCSAVTARPAC